jgi:hypothetical protein
MQRPGGSRRAILFLALMFSGVVQVGCYEEDDYEIGTKDGVPVDEVVALSCTPASVSVGTKVDCVATIPKGLEAAKRRVLFQTDFGSFAEQGAPTTFERVASRDGEARVKLESAAPGVARVAATIADVTSDNVEVTFDQLGEAAVVTDVTAEGFALEATARHELAVAAKLETAEGGLPRPRQTATFGLFRDLNETTNLAEARIRALSTSDASGRVSATISAGETSHRGPVWLRACLADSVDLTTCASLELLVVDPAE